MQIRDRRGQLSIEYLVITSFILVISGVLFGFSLFTFNENAGLSQAKEAVSAVVTHANLVASLGEGSKVYFNADLPDGVSSFSVSGTAVNLVASIGGKTTTVYDYTKASITPAVLSSVKGRQSLSASFIDGNVVIANAG